MKKKVLFISMCLVVMAAVSYQHHSHNSNVNNLLLDNIEALASDETSYTIHCFNHGSIDCPVDHEKVYNVHKGYSLEKHN